MSDPGEFVPRMRPVEAIPMQSENETFVLLRDPDDLAGQPLGLPMPLFMIISMMDGNNSLRDIQAEIQREFQQLIPTDQLMEVVTELDKYYLLDNERAQARREDVEREYLGAPVRPMAHADSAYPADPAECVAFLDSAMRAPSGPQGVEPRNTTAPRGMVTPHIDLREGAPTMAVAFNQLRVPEPPTLYIILGVAHHPTENLFTLSDKDFDTPFGPAKVHTAAAARLKELFGAERLAGEYAHRHEHSIEFQAVFLKFIHQAAGHEFAILPILCGSLHEELELNRSPKELAEVGEFCDALKTVIAEFGPRVCVIAGVDLSHVGPKFGDERPVDDFRAELIESADKRMLENVAARDPEAFFDHFRPDLNARNVDAVTAVYVMLNALGGGSGELLQYKQYREAETASLVSYASVVLD